MPVIYSFEAKSIQSYILDSSQLRDMVGASEQIENLTHGLLDNVLQALKLSVGKDIQFSRRACGVFTAVLKTLEQAEKLRDLWTFTVRYRLPDLQFVQGLQENTNILTAEKATQEQKLADRNRQFPTFPIAGPFVARGPYTGKPAITTKFNVLSNHTECLDKSTVLKREFLHRAKVFNGGLALEKKFKLTTAVWPLNMGVTENEDDEQHFPMLGDNRYIGILHANGNGLGELLMDMREAVKVSQYYVDIFSTLAVTIEKATIAAARQATQKVLVPKADLRENVQGKKLQVIPARPLILGSDNLTMIIRGELTIPFTQHFLEAFEHHSEQLFVELTQKYKEKGLKNLKIPKSLTASAGIVFIKASQPFYLASELAESLCETAKKYSKQSRSLDGRIPSSLAFHRITTTIINDYDIICQHELSTPTGWILSMQPYAVGYVQPAPDTKINNLPRLHDLNELRKLLTDDKINQGAVRELLNLLHFTPKRAKRAFKRWRENMQKMPWDRLREFDNILKTLNVECDKELPILTAKSNRTPLVDAETWNSITRGSNV